MLDVISASLKEQRSLAIEKYQLTTTFEEQTYEHITQLASQLLALPIALIVVNSEQEHTHSNLSELSVNEVGTPETLCALMGQSNELMMISDLQADARLRGMSFSYQGQPIRSFIGAPLLASDGLHLGALCLMDFQPRQFTSNQVDTLQLLSTQVAVQIEMRREHLRLLDQFIEQEQQNSTLQYVLAQQQAVFEMFPDGLILLDHENRILHANQSFLDMWQVPSHVDSSHMSDVMPVRMWMVGMLRDPGLIVPRLQAVEADPKLSSQNLIVLKDDRVIDCTTHPHIVDDVVVGRVWHFRDVTDAILAEDEQNRLQEELIFAQADALKEMSTPLLPISSHAVLMPIIGSLNGGRAHQLITTLLAGVQQHKARVAILDITGVQMLDTYAAKTFASAANAVRLLGATMIMTGVSPEVAQTLVSLRIELPNIRLCKTLQEGINQVISRAA